MVRVNLISPQKLADQHLVAEYLEILMLVGYVKNYPKLEGIKKEYCLGKGHIKFFKNKLGYLKNRHEKIKKEMRKRGFATTKTINLETFDSKFQEKWKPSKKDFGIVKKRILWKIKNKPNYYNYYGKKKSLEFFEQLLSKY